MLAYAAVALLARFAHAQPQQPDVLTGEERAWLAAHPVIRLAPDRSYPPIEFIGEDGRYVGIAADYVRLLEQKLGIQFAFVPGVRWDATLNHLRGKQVDLLASCVITPKRQEWALFTEPFLKLKNVIIVRKTAPQRLKLKDLRSLAVEVVAGHAVYDYLLARGLVAATVPDFRTGLRRVSFGNSDAMVGDLAAASYLIEKERITNLKIAGDVGYEYQIALACRKDWPELQRILNKGLALITPQERQAIINKWVRLELPHSHGREVWAGAALAVLGAILVLGIAGAWTRSLKRQVQARTEELNRELTERRQAEEERKRLEKELRQAQKMEVMGTLAGGIAHDFNNLLTIITGFTELARTHLPPGHPAHEPLDIVETAADDASSVTRSLLTLSRKAAALRSPLDLREMLRDSARFLCRILPATIEWRQDLGSEGPVAVNADVGQLRQVLLNVVTNARDAMPHGGRLTLTLRTEPVRGEPARTQAVITVEDTGEGISGDALEHVFDPFFTTKPAGKGTGLGLAMARAIILEHEGEIRIDSAPGQGTRVRIELPVCGGAVDGSADRPADGSASGDGRTALLAEDSPQVRAVVCRALQKAGFRVIEAGSGEDARGQLQAATAPYDLAVLDVDLPGVDGVEVAGMIRQVMPTCPVILMSGNADVRITEDARQRFLPKPFAMSELVSLATQLIGERGQ